MNEKKSPMKIDHEKLRELIGEPFDEFFRVFEQAERKLAAHAAVAIPKEDFENSVRYLRFMSIMMATKAGVYAATASIGFTFDPAVAYENLLKAVVAGMNAGVSIHRRECSDPTCDATSTLLAFLADVAEAERVADEFASAATPSAPKGKPVVN